MIHRMRTPRGARGWVVTLACLLAWAVVPGGQAAAQELEIPHDARLEGYGGEKMVMEESNNAMTWMGFGVLAVVTVLGLFKDAKRSHLD